MEIKYLELKRNKDLDFWFSNTTYLNEKQQSLLHEYFKLIVEKNKVMNLTGIDTLQGVYLKHFYDSLTLYELINEYKIESIADVGSGAGVPGIILAIAFPNKKITLIEPMTKRCNFLKEVIEYLKLENVKISNKRAEDINIQYDAVVSRAVARLNILLELAIPITKIEGLFIAMKGQNYQEEVVKAKNSLLKLDAKIIEVHTCILPIENSNRANIIIQKKKETNKLYPRNYSLIKKNPL